MNKRWLGLIFVFASVLFSSFVYNELPARVATHFDASGQPNGWSSRAVAAYLIPLVNLLFVGIANVIPKVLPRRENFVRFEDTYWFIMNVIIAFLCAMNVVVLGRALGWPVNITTFVLLGIGGMFMIMGNVMPRIRSNWIMGIRTPWTLDSDSVWRATHRVGGRTFVIGGLVTMIAAFLPARLQPVVAIVALVIAGFIPVVYSYFAWRREKQATT